MVKDRRTLVYGSRREVKEMKRKGKINKKKTDFDPQHEHLRRQKRKEK